MTTGETIGTGRYPAYTDKHDILEAIYHIRESDKSGALDEIYYKLGNTNLAGVSNASDDIDTFEAAVIR